MTTMDILQADASLEEALTGQLPIAPGTPGTIETSNHKSKTESLSSAPTGDRKSLTELTRREKQVLRAVVAGKTNKQIAQELCRSQRTVEYHRNRLMRKLNVHNVAELVKQAVTTRIQ